MIAAATGLRAWLVQRLTGVVIAGAVIWLTLSLVLAPPQDLTAWRAWLGGPVVSLSFSACFIAVLLHAWVGMRDVIMDYVHPPLARVACLSLIAIVLVLSGLWLFKVVYGMAA